MALTTSRCTTYVGRLEDLPANASPGLLYLKSYFQVLRSPQPAIEQLQKILAPDAVFMQDGAAPIPAFPVACTPEQRAKSQKNPISFVNWELRCARDIVASEKTRTVTYEVVAEYWFGTDGGSPVRIVETGVIELRRTGANEEEVDGIQDYIATETRAWQNKAPLKEKMLQLMSLERK